MFLGVAGVCDTAPDEVPQARLLAVDRVGNAPVLLFPHPVAVMERLGHHTADDWEAQIF